jgi:hypothetical protein
MKYIPLTKNQQAIVDDCDYKLVSKYKWYFDKLGYAATNAPMIKGKRYPTIRMHRLIMKPSKGLEIDHISRDGLDNRRCNLRICNHRDNLRNSKLRKDNTSGYKGVHFYKLTKKWQAKLMVENKTISLGYYKNKEDAARAYNDGAIKHFGKFARLNILRG